MSIQDPICTAYVHSLVYIVHTQCRYNIDSMYIVYFSTYRQQAHKNGVKAFSKHHSFFHALVFSQELYILHIEFFSWPFEMTTTSSLNYKCMAFLQPCLNFQEVTQVYHENCINNLATYVGSKA